MVITGDGELGFDSGEGIEHVLKETHSRFVVVEPQPAKGRKIIFQLNVLTPPVYLELGGTFTPTYWTTSVQDSSTWLRS